MSDTTKIEWCDSTFNPWIGCTKVGPGCDHCYAEVSTPSRTLGVVWGPKAQRHRTSVSNWAMPLRWERDHEAFFAQHGRRRRVFCASLADVFDNQVPPAWRAELFALIADTPHLNWLLVTKRISNVPKMVMKANTDRFLNNEGFSHGLPGNVWLYDYESKHEAMGEWMGAETKLRFAFKNSDGILEPTDHGVLAIDAAVRAVGQ